MLNALVGLLLIAAASRLPAVATSLTPASIYLRTAVTNGLPAAKMGHERTSLRMTAKSLPERIYEAQDSIVRVFESEVSDRVFPRAFAALDNALDDALLEPNPVHPKFTKNPVPKKVRAILALDGGGVRGLITAYVLLEVQNEIRRQATEKYGEAVGGELKLGQVFDVVAGTSTGSLLATYLTTYCLAEPNTLPGTNITLDGSCEQAIELYKHLAKKIFGEQSKYTEVFGKQVRVPLKRTFANVWKYTRGLRPGYLHSDSGLNDALEDTFGNLTLNWLATEAKTIDEVESHVASLYVVTYDMVYRRPVLFHADRFYRQARFLTADPFSAPYDEGGFTVHVAKEKAQMRSSELEEAYQKYKDEHPDSILFSKRSVGDAQVPLSKELAENHVRYSRSLDKHVNVTLGQVCRCSVAAPVYLRPGYIKDFFGTETVGREPIVCCDGGVVANAPANACFNAEYFTVVAALEGKSLTTTNGPKERKGANVADFASHMVLSIGCGQLGKEVDAEKVKNAGLLNYLLPTSTTGNIIEVLMSTSAQISHVNLEALFASHGQWQNYLRIQLSANDQGEPGGITNKKVVEALKVLDNSSDDALKVYEQVGQFLAEVYKPDIKKFVKKLLKYPKRTAKRD